MSHNDTDSVEVETDSEDERSLLWGKPMQARTFHIFEEESGRSLCRAYGFFSPIDAEEVSGGESYRKGRDCKQCCRKAGLLSEDEDADEGGR